MVRAADCRSADPWFKSGVCPSVWLSLNPDPQVAIDFGDDVDIVWIWIRMYKIWIWYGFCMDMNMTWICIWSGHAYGMDITVRGAFQKVFAEVMSFQQSENGRGITSARNVQESTRPQSLLPSASDYLQSRGRRMGVVRVPPTMRALLFQDSWWNRQDIHESYLKCPHQESNLGCRGHNTS